MEQGGVVHSWLLDPSVCGPFSPSWLESETPEMINHFSAGFFCSEYLFNVQTNLPLFQALSSFCSAVYLKCERNLYVTKVFQSV